MRLAAWLAFLLSVLAVDARCALLVSLGAAISRPAEASETMAIRAMRALRI